MGQKELFERFQILGVQLKDAAGIVQNPLGSLEQQDKEYFLDTMDQIGEELVSLKEDVLKYYGEEGS